MGQYYKPVNLDKIQHLYSWDYDNGLKLMEHSYIGNSFVGAVENLLMPNGNWHKTRIVWAGDYADPEIRPDGTVMTREEDGHVYEQNLYGLFNEENNTLIKPTKTNVPKKFKYICNHSKKEYVLVDRSDDGRLIVHPLPLLTCEGNGNGGGDYYGDESFVGSWARDVISVEEKKPEGFKRIKPEFYD